MTLYARSDVLLTSVPLTAGGCGTDHGRPTPKGAPVKIWALNCPRCENHLRTSDQWSATISSIPETPDEIETREDQEKRGQRALEDATGTALQKLGDLPEVMAQIAQQNGANQTMMIAMLTALVDKGIISMPVVPAVAAKPEPEDLPDLNAMSIRELQDFARARDVKTTRGKDDQIQLILTHFAERV
jgi:hypothetical protein